MVDPQAMSERTQNSCVGMPRRRATSLPAATIDGLTCALHSNLPEPQTATSRMRLQLQRLAR